MATLVTDVREPEEEEEKGVRNTPQPLPLDRCRAWLGKVDANLFPARSSIVSKDNEPRADGTVPARLL